MPSVNMLPKPVVARRARAGILRAWGASLCLAAGTIAAGAIALQAKGVMGQDGLQRAADSVSSKTAQIQGEIPALQAQIAVQKRRLSMIDTLEDRPDWGVLLAYLHTQRGEGVMLQSCSLTWSPEGVMTFKLTGLGESPGRERTIVQGLEDSGLFSSTTLLGTRRENVAGGERIVFDIACEFNPALAEAPAP